MNDEMEKRLRFTCLNTATVNQIPDTGITVNATAAQTSAYLLKILLPDSERWPLCIRRESQQLVYRVGYRASIAALQPDIVLRGESLRRPSCPC